MASNLAATFLRCSLGPIQYAGGCILGGRVPDGLAELSADNLYGGVKRGIAATAQQVGVPTGYVERILPAAELHDAAARLDVVQRDALAAWALYAGHVGGLLKGVADLTVDGRAPDVSHFLSRLAKKLDRDKPLSEPLEALSDALAHWLDLIERCGEVLADGGALEVAYRRRRLKRVALAIGLAGAAAAGVVFFVRHRLVDARIEAALGQLDPCAEMSCEDASHASEAQLARADKRHAVCDDRRATQARLEAEAKQKEEAIRREAEEKKAREARCAALGDHVAAGELTQADEAAAGDQAALLKRVSKRSLDPSDLTTTASFPCTGSPASAKLAGAFEAAVLAQPLLWAKSDDPSPAVQDILVKHAGELPPMSKQVLADAADDAAKRVKMAGDESARPKAKKLCALRPRLGATGGKFCPGVLADSK